LSAALRADNAVHAVTSLPTVFTMSSDLSLARQPSTGTESNGPTEAVNNLIKRIKRIIGFGFRRFGHSRSGSCSTPELLPTVTPR
jgi:Transposase